jgi:hypothetical protein
VGSCLARCALIAHGAALKMKEREPSLPEDPLIGRKVLVVGVSPEVNHSVTESLRNVGIAAQGTADPDRATEMFDAKNFELIAFGRATAGRVAEGIKTKFRAQHPDVLLIDVIGPFAQRQITAALKHDPRSVRFARDLRVINNMSGATILVHIVASCHVTLTLFQKHADGLTSRVLTEFDAEVGPLEWPLNSVDMVGAFSIVLDASGEEFLHYAFL